MKYLITLIKRSRISFTVLFISSLAAAFIFNYFQFDDASIIDLLLVIVLPVFLTQLIYLYIVRRKRRSINS